MSSCGPIGSVRIPAHNEGAVIGRCLHHPFEGSDGSDRAVAVVCNGCTDDTASVARASGHTVDVVELDEASKPAALRAGDRLLRTFPRLYVNADVVLRGPISRQVLEHLAQDASVAARLPFRYDATHSTGIVRRYYRARSRVPAVMGSIWGAGVYGPSAAGRARFGDHPDVVAEDLFVHQCFDPDEIDIVGDEPVVVVAPAHYLALLKVMRRAYRGAAENRAATERRDVRDREARLRRRPCVTYSSSVAACPASSTRPRTPSWPSLRGSTSRSAARHAGSETSSRSVAGVR